MIKKYRLDAEQPSVVVHPNALFEHRIVAVFTNPEEAALLVDAINTVVDLGPHTETLIRLTQHWQGLTEEERTSGGMTAELRSLLDRLVEADTDLSKGLL